MPYLNSEVFYRALPPEDYDLVPMPPRAMAAAVERDDLDAGPLPVAEVLRLGGLLIPVGDFCVATGRRANSVLLLSATPAEALDGKTVAVTAHTATSIQLLRVLFADVWHVRPARYVELDAPHDARLVIGDEALRLRRGEPPYQVIYDLGEEWRRLTGLPFVFAVWAIRADCGAQAAIRLAGALDRSIKTSLGQIDAIAREYRNSYLTEQDVAEYVRSFIYRLGPDERRAIEEFRARLATLPEWRPGQPARAKIGA
jgi:chorismate dehydratase